jgi:hypothetical protein
MNRKLIRIALAAAVLMLSSAHADCGKYPECDDLTSWSRFTAVTLKLSEPGLRYSATWLAEFDHQKMDILVRTDTKDGRGKSMKGDVAMVGGRIMMSKGLTLEPGYEIDAMDAPILSMRLAMIVLARAYPKGPASISGEKRIDRSGDRYSPTIPLSQAGSHMASDPRSKRREAPRSSTMAPSAIPTPGSRPSRTFAHSSLGKTIPASPMRPRTSPASGRRNAKMRSGFRPSASARTGSIRLFSAAPEVAEIRPMGEKHLSQATRGSRS